MFRITIVLVLIPLISCFVVEESVGQDATPTANEILQKYVQATGGEEALSSVSTMKLVTKEVGRVKVGDDEGTYESTITRLQFDKRWVKINSQATDFGFDGSRYWMRHEDGQSQFYEAPRYPFDCFNPVSYPLHLADFPGTIDFAGKTEIGGKPAYRLKVEPAVPEPSDRVRMTPQELVFDAETGLLVKIVHEARIVEFADYREVDEIMVSFKQKIATKFSDILTEFEVTTESIEFDIQLQDRLLSPDEANDN